MKAKLRARQTKPVRVSYEIVRIVGCCLFGLMLGVISALVMTGYSRVATIVALILGTIFGTILSLLIATWRPGRKVRSSERRSKL